MEGAEPNHRAVFRNALLRLRVHQTALKMIGGAGCRRATAGRLPSIEFRLGEYLGQCLPALEAWKV